MNLITSLSLMVTYQCNVACKHCGPFCGPKEQDWMTYDEILDVINQADTLGATNIVFTGGEPSLLGEKLNRLLEYIRDKTNVESTRIVTNAKWASTYDKAYKKLKSWKESGLIELNISCGEYHQEFIPISSVINAFKAGCDLNYDTVLLAGEFIKGETSTTQLSDFENELGEILVNPSNMMPYSKKLWGLSTGAVMAYGRGKKYVKDDMLILSDEKNIQSQCGDVNSVITIHPNGSVTACCGVMVREESPLTIGNWRESSLLDILQTSNEDLILNWVKYVGLKDMKSWLVKKDPDLKDEIGDQHVSICDLCAKIMYNSKCVKLLFEEGAERNDAIITNKISQEATIYNPNYEL